MTTGYARGCVALIGLGVAWLLAIGGHWPALAGVLALWALAWRGAAR